MLRKLAARGLWRGVGSMDFIHTLIIENDLDENDLDHHTSELTVATRENMDSAATSTVANPNLSLSNPLVNLYTCRQCRPMPQAVDNQCCRQRKCITTTSCFTKRSELCMQNTIEIRNDRKDTSS